MKRTKRRLSIGKQTIRTLETLADVHGGSPESGAVTCKAVPDSANQLPPMTMRPA